MTRIKWFAALALLALMFAPVARAEEAIRNPSLSVEEAYKAIPHNKTRFDPAAAKMEPAEKEFLDTFFGLSDLAVAEKVETQIAVAAKRPAPADYDDILRRLKALAVPLKLKDAYQLVTAAVEEQRQYLDSLKDGGAFDANAPLVESSHQKLVQAYGELMRLYPSEDAHNKQAFFDHLCALDFK